MGLAEIYYHVNTDRADSRTNDWWLVTSPLPVLTIVASYLYFVLVCGPRWMRNRKPYSLKTFLTCYNIFQIITNVMVIYKLITAGWLTHLTLGCEPIDYSLDPMAVQQAHVIWWAMMLRLTDLSETVVFIFRKKDKQISFLHVYHHVATVLILWSFVKYFAGGMWTFPLIINSCVHVIMYTYYYLSSRRTKIERLVTYIKPYITTIQIIQFCALLTHASQALLPSCDVSTGAAVMWIINLLINLYLFMDFYRTNYLPA